MEKFYDEEIELDDIDKLFKFSNNTLISLYLKEIGEYPLLSKEEEIECAIKIRKGLELINDSSLSKNENIEANKDIISQMEIAKDKLINSNLKYVVAIAKKYSWSTLPLDELIQDGNMGLIKAVEKYDYMLGFRFTTYATSWIKQSITKAISKKSSDIRLPSHIYEKLSKVRKCESDLWIELNQKPTNKNIADKLGIDEVEVLELKSYAYTFMSLDSYIAGNEDLTLQSTISDNSSSPFEDTITQINNKVLEEAVNKLDNINKEVIAMVFGLYGNEVHTLEAISKKLNVSAERIRQRKNNSLNLLERYLTNKL